MKMKVIPWMLLAGFLAVRTHNVWSAESAEALYKKAYTAETVEREPAKAIDLYKEVVSQTSDQDPLAAKAH